MDVGNELRRARQARGLSLDDVAGETKISPALLRAIERNDFEHVPGGLFTRGYLRAYARVVGLDPQPIVDGYRAEFDVPEPPPGAEEHLQPTHSTPIAYDVEDEASLRRPGNVVQFVVVLVVALAYLASLRQAKPAANADLQLPDAAATVAAAEPTDVRPVGTSGSLPASDKPMVMEMRPVGPCWVDATVDGEHTVARLMNAGDVETVRMREDLTLRVGDPAAFAFKIDGVSGRSLGVEGHPVTVRINRGNYQGLLSR